MKQTQRNLEPLRQLSITPCKRQMRPLCNFSCRCIQHCTSNPLPFILRDKNPWRKQVQYYKYQHINYDGCYLQQLRKRALRTMALVLSQHFIRILKYKRPIVKGRAWPPRPLEAKNILELLFAHQSDLSLGGQRTISSLIGQAQDKLTNQCLWHLL